jgi:hypothetical protein
MKIKFTLFLLSLSFLSHAKFAQWVFNIPCHQVTLKVKSCKDYSFSNKDLLLKRFKNKADLKRLTLNYSGAIVSGDILSLAPEKCYESQRVDISRYKELQKEFDHFFINKRSCKETTVRSTTKFIIKRFFCDTPGAPSIPDCFISRHARKQKFYFSN